MGKTLISQAKLLSRYKPLHLNGGTRMLPESNSNTKLLGVVAGGGVNLGPSHSPRLQIRQLASSGVGFIMTEDILKRLDFGRVERWEELAD